MNMNERDRIGVKILESKAIHPTSLVRRRRIERLKAVRETIINSNENKDLTEMETTIESESKRNRVSNKRKLLNELIRKRKMMGTSISYDKSQNVINVVDAKGNDGKILKFRRAMISELFK